MSKKGMLTVAAGLVGFLIAGPVGAIAGLAMGFALVNAPDETHREARAQETESPNKMDSMKILYTQDSISATFQDGTSIYTADSRTLDRFKALRVYFDEKVEKYRSLDNRRLWVAKNLGVAVRVIIVNANSVDASRITASHGHGIQVRNRRSY